MKIVETSGCTAANLTVDGVSIQDLDEMEVFDALVPKLRAALQRNEVGLCKIVNLFQYDSYESDNEPCDQCGDCVSVTTWNLE